MGKIHSVAIIGGGVSGAVTALELANIGIDSVLFEKKKRLVNGPPFCHLHAGGNLYPDITDEQCRILMKQSIEMARLFPESIDKRPTLIAVQKTEPYEIENITNRLKMLQEYYESLIKENPANEVLGSPEHYYKIYSEEDITSLNNQASVKTPTTANEWVINASKLIDFEKLKTPVILVQEYGWNFFRVAAQAQLALQKTNKCTLKTETEVVEIKYFRDNNNNYNWEVHTKNEIYRVKYLVNSCGYKTGMIDESLKLTSEKSIEFKASYVSKWEPIHGLIPELIFHGKRGTDNGMAQLTPYCDDYYQIHGMTKKITLFKNGLLRSKKGTKQPKFEQEITQKLELGWNKNDADQRTKKSIEFIARYIPTFTSAVAGGPPLYGAQQIKGVDPDLRVGEVSFDSKNYARSEIIKASSALTVARQIINQLQEEKIIQLTVQSENKLLNSIAKSDIDKLAAELTVERGYSEALSRLVIKN